MSTTIRAIVICTTLFSCFITYPAVGQEFGRVDDILNTGAAYYTFSQPGEATVQVIVLGSISRPGIYEIGIGVDLGQLLALSGGPPFTTTSGTTTSRNETTLRLFREATGRRDLVYEAPLELMLREPGLYPPLQDGDIFTVETNTVQKQRFVWRDAWTIVSSLGTIALIIERISSR